MAQDQIAFRSGTMLHFIAARTFALGQTGIQISKGMDVYFDGTKVSVDGNEVTMPQFRGAIRSGWLVLAENFDEDSDEASRPVAANIQVRHATQGGNPFTNQAPVRSAMTTTETDEREVGNVGNHANATRQANTGFRRGNPVANNPGSSVENQDGVAVRRLKTSNTGEKSKGQRTVLTPESAGGAIREASSVQIQPGQGMTQQEMLDRMDPEEAEAYLEKKQALAASHFDPNASQGKVVGRVPASKAPKTRDGITARVTTGGGVETADPSGMGGKVVESVEVVEGMVFRNTNTGKPKPAAPAPKPVLVKENGNTDVRRRVAKSICPDFPDNYDFALPDRKKLARLQADYDDREDVLRAVFAAESDAFKVLLIEEFPEVFAA